MSSISLSEPFKLKSIIFILLSKSLIKYYFYLPIYPSGCRNIEASKGYKHFTLDRTLDITKLEKFCVVYVHSFLLIIFKQTYIHFIANRSLIDYVKMNGMKLLAQFQETNNNKII